MTNRSFANLALLIGSIVLASTASKGAESGAVTRQALTAEWTKKVGYARMDLNNVQILPDLRMTRDFEADDTIRGGTRITVRAVDVADDRRCIDIEVKEADSKRWTEVHLVLAEPIGSTISGEQVAQLNAMWARLVSSAPPAGAAGEDDPPASAGAPDTGATVHIYRPRKVTGGAVGHSVACDWLDIGLLENGRYFTVVIPPGTHEFFATSLSSKRVTLSLAAGREYYLRDFIAWSGVVLEESPAEEGSAAIRKLKYADLQDIRDRRRVKTEKAN